MAVKVTEIDPRIGNNRVGFMVTRSQIEQSGHAALKFQMFRDNSRNLLGMGSSEKFGIHGNPLTPEQKLKAQIGVWGDAFDVLFLQDIGATDLTTDWGDYVFDRIRSEGLPEPTDFYAGSRHEARWYEHLFTPLSGDPSYTRGDFAVWEDSWSGKRIHILDRKQHIQISSSEVRTMIEQRDPEWKNYVSAKLHDFYDYEYPPHLRVAITLPADRNSWPGLERYPVGTKGVRENHGDQVEILRADGVWRPKTDKDDAKSLGD